MSEKETMIRLEGIKKRFRTKAGELEVLHGVSADIKKGEVFGIIGLSGAGKSTLVRCINLLERPTAGKVWLDGVELTALDDKELREQRRHMGMIFQQFHLLMQRTALDNVCFPMEISGAGGPLAVECGVVAIFRAPKTKIGQELVMHEGTNREAYTGKLPHSYRLVFKGGSENEPVLGQMMIELKNVVNILAANTRTIENQAFGQMLVQFPEEKEIRQKMIQYLTDRGVEVEEVEYV